MALQFYSGADFMTQVKGDVAWVWQPYVPAGGKVMLNGPSSAGKSQFLWQLLNAVQAGTDFMRMPTQQGNALLLNLDMDAALMKHRWDEHGFRPRFDILTGDPLDCLSRTFSQTDTYAALSRTGSEKRYVVVGIDALAEVFSGSPNQNEIVVQAYNTFRLLFTGAAIIYLHHDRKRRITELGSWSARSDEDSLGAQNWKNLATSAMHIYPSTEYLVELDHSKSQVALLEPPMTMLREETGALVRWDADTIEEMAREFDQVLLIARVSQVKNQDDLEALVERLKPRGLSITTPRMRRLFLAWATRRANQGGK